MRAIVALAEKGFPHERSLLDVGAPERLLRCSWAGRLDFDAALRWDAADQSVRLTPVRVQDLVMTSGGDATRSGTERLGAAVAERMLEDLSLYCLSPERDAQLQQKGCTPSAVTVTSRGVEITFEAVKR